MILQFTLSMPNNNAWNGKWSGEDNPYIICRNYSKKKANEILTHGDYHYYNFGDGWGAGVTIKTIDSNEKRKALRTTQGFSGYDWMVDSIEQYGKILNSIERKKIS